MREIGHELQPAWDASILELGVHQLGRLYGINGLEVHIRPGAGWSCGPTERGIAITVDPLLFAEMQAGGPEAPAEPAELKPEYVLYATAHELGHARDITDTSHNDGPEAPAEQFFWNVIDDTVINTRQRRIPLFDACTDELYSKVLFPVTDLTDKPKHAQLMFGILLDTVTRNSLPVLEPEVISLLERFANYEKNGRAYDLLQIMTDPRTTLRERRQIAGTFIMPHYKSLLEQDEQDLQSENKSGEDATQSTGAAAENKSGQFQPTYDEYDKTMHGQHRHSHDDTATPDQQSEQPSFAEELAKAIRQAEEQQNKAEAPAEPEVFPISTPATQDGPERLTALAGSIAAEMQLAPEDAVGYANTLSNFTGIIREVAEVFMRLALPTTTPEAPRYARDATTEGVRLHPGAIARIPLQIATNDPQAVWQSLDRRAPRQEMAFGGLDVTLAVDASGSMAGARAECAAAAGVCLAEGLQLARYLVATASNQSRQPDVRTQIIAFGSGTEVLSPLSYQPTGPQKGQMYSNLLRPASPGTLINDTLKHVLENRTEAPARDHIVIIISDGSFFDYKDAEKTAATLSGSTHIAQLVITATSAHQALLKRLITPHYQILSDPSTIPERLYNVLAMYTDKFRINT